MVNSPKITNMKDKLELAKLLNELYYRSISQYNKELGWKPHFGMFNFIEELEAIGVDFSKVQLEKE